MRIILAPVMGITDHLYRTAFARHFTGVEGAMAPFVSSVRARSVRPGYLKDLLPAHNQLLPLVPQILSNDPDDFLFLARLIRDLGYPVVNWNLGCPSPTVVNKRRGSGLLPFPDDIRRFLDLVTAGLPAGALSIKLRLGLNQADEIEALWPALNSYPLAQVIVHPRLGRQLYAGQVDLAAFDRCQAHCRHHLVYNGDIRTGEDFQDRRRRFPGIESWMLGRGLLSDPFLAAELQTFHNPSLKCHRDIAIVKQFHAELYEGYRRVLSGPAHLLDRMKGHWQYLAENFVHPDQTRKTIHKTKTTDHYLDAVRRLFDSADGIAPRYSA
ncbi:MAG: tRNA-dihydrouridine synthase family protein [Desulfobacteraceae bacterium]|nr:tRNA-dihydrouridine synthase family protein [Desulfobacteraceae bacterium]